VLAFRPASLVVVLYLLQRKQLRLNLAVWKS
jgi:hypothetical protein